MSSFRDLLEAKDFYVRIPSKLAQKEVKKLPKGIDFAEGDDEDMFIGTESNLKKFLKDHFLGKYIQDIEEN